MKKLKTVGILASLLVTAGAVLPTATAFAATPSANTPKLESVSYEGNGVVELEFKKDVLTHKNQKITVKDNKGATYSATLSDKDGDDELKLKIKNYRADRTYSFSISGIRNEGSSTYKTISGKVKIPLRTLAIKKTTYKNDGRVDVDFKYDVDYKSGVNVTVKDSKGKSYSTKILSKDDDELNFRILNAKAGTSYTYTINGVRPEGTTTNKKISGKVTIPKAKTSYIGTAKAKQVALNKAGLKESQVKGLKVELDKDDNVYEIDFRRGGWEYEFEINAKTGKIVDWDKEYDD